MNIRRLAGLIPALLISTQVAADVIDVNLLDQMEEVGAEGTVSALVYLNAQVDVKALSDDIAEQRFTRSHRHQIVVDALRDMANATQGPLLARLGELQDQGSVDRIKPFWISNLVSIQSRPSVIMELSDRDDVLHIYRDYGIELIEPVSGPIDNPRGQARG
ncbi:MAG: hypothetical protein MK089_10405, partial [Phycisphaerales bacterium]|nr:hypothetical protein [Phycisphaerales bacterium]